MKIIGTASLNSIFMITLMLFTKLVGAQTLHRLEVSNPTPSAGETIRFSVHIASSSDLYACGLEFDFGDGTKKQIRVLEKKDLPVIVDHSYKSEGNYAVKVDGVFLHRGLKSVTACEKSLARSILVGSADNRKPPCISPADEYRAVECPSGTIGKIIERRTFSCPGPTASAWSPQSIDCRAPRL